MSTIYIIGLLIALNVLSAQALGSQLSPTPKGSVSWVVAERSVLIRLDTPDLPLRVWDKEDKKFVSTNQPSALVLNFTLSEDSAELLLQDQPFLPLPDPNYPPRISAYQIPADSFSPYNALNEPGVNHQLLHLDYERFVNNRDDPSIVYWNWWPILAINILGVGIGDDDLVLLPNMTQKVLKIKLHDLHSVGHGSEFYNAKFVIKAISFADRGQDFTFRAPEDLEECTIWSWCCHDSSPGNDPPWYRYIYRHSFDEFGKIGSMRHHILERWNVVHSTLGIWRIALGGIFFLGLVLFPPLQTGFLYLWRKFEMTLADYRAYRREEAYWMKEEEEFEVGDYFRENGTLDQMSVRKGSSSADLPGSIVKATEETTRPLPPSPTVLTNVVGFEEEKV